LIGSLSGVNAGNIGDKGKDVTGLATVQHYPAQADEEQRVHGHIQSFAFENIRKHNLVSSMFNLVQKCLFVVPLFSFSLIPLGAANASMGKLAAVTPVDGEAIHIGFSQKRPAEVLGNRPTLR
jgi:hypothetical protein